MLIDIPEIPFVLMELDTSLMTDIADYQISLLNLASSDVNYALKSNFPFYVAQFNPVAELPTLRPPEVGCDGPADAHCGDRVPGECCAKNTAACAIDTDCCNYPAKTCNSGLCN